MAIHEDPLGPPRDSEKKPHPPGPLGLVMLGAVLAGFVLYLVFVAIDGDWSLIFFSFPMVTGFVIGLYRPAKAFRTSLIAYLGLSVLILVTFLEGMLCFMMATPILLPMCLIGAFTGATLKKFLNSRKSQIAAVTGLALLDATAYKIESHFYRSADHPWHTVTAEIVVNQPIARVFAHLTGFDPEKGDQNLTQGKSHRLAIKPRWPLLLKLGFPIPQGITLYREPGQDKNSVGPSVEMEFNHGVATGSTTTWNPPHTWSFRLEKLTLVDKPFFKTRLSPDDHYGLKKEDLREWLTFGSFTYQLDSLGSEKTRLTRITRFQRHLFPDFYFGFVMETVMSQGSKALLEGVTEVLRAPTNPVLHEAAIPQSARIRRHHSHPPSKHL